MKWNWGTKIATLYSVFVLFILGMVYMAFRQKYDLVTEDYYAKEIAYQSTIDSRIRAEGLAKSLKISIENNKLKISFSNDNPKIKGNVNCFRPSDETRDFHEDFFTKNGIFYIPLNKFIKGKYLLKINWEPLESKESHRPNFYQEKVIIIP